MDRVERKNVDRGKKENRRENDFAAMMRTTGIGQLRRRCSARIRFDHAMMLAPNATKDNGERSHSPMDRNRSEIQSTDE